MHPLMALVIAMIPIAVIAPVAIIAPVARWPIVGARIGIKKRLIRPALVITAVLIVAIAAWPFLVIIDTQERTAPYRVSPKTPRHRDWRPRWACWTWGRGDDSHEGRRPWPPLGEGPVRHNNSETRDDRKIQGKSPHHSHTSCP